MDKILSDLIEWFRNRPLWQQDALCRLIDKGQIDENDINELIILCKQEVGILDPKFPILKPRVVPEKAFQELETSQTTSIDEISDLKGINALQPRTPLVFGKDGLTIVYGGNGSGKSGYVRLLKHACGARKTGYLYRNIFDSTKDKQSCNIQLNTDGLSKKIYWSPEIGIIEDLKSVEIYDTECGHVYLTEENEVAYEPWILSILTKLTEICLSIGQSIKNEIESSSRIIPQLPAKYRDTDSASWYNNLSHETKLSEVEIRCSWTLENENKLLDISKRLAEPNPEEKAKEHRKLKSNLLALKDLLKGYVEKLSDAKCTALLNAKSDAELKRKAVDEDAKKIFENAPLEGIGSESWRLLWEQARKFSESLAYPGISFPNTNQDSRCILCQQPIDLETKNRLNSFEEFIKGGLEQQAREAEELVKKLIDELPVIISEENIIPRIEAAGIKLGDLRNQILIYRNLIEKRLSLLLSAKKISDIAALPANQVLNMIQKLADDEESRAKEYDEDATGQNREKLEKQKIELEARRWLSEQKENINVKLSV